MHIKKLIISLLFVSSLNTLNISAAQQKGYWEACKGITTQCFNNSKDFVINCVNNSTETIKEVLKYPSVIKAKDFYSQYSLAIPATLCAGYEVITKKDNIDKASGVIANFASTYAGAAMLSYLQATGFIDETNSKETLIKYYTLSCLLSKSIYKITDLVSNKVITLVKNKINS